ncbi:MAG: methyltransferase domain-containing protein [Chloroflexi bacterium]|nr:methyltransferase domain-containing protein [Chloroflexota bacterium]
MEKPLSPNAWNASLYDDKHHYVADFGEQLIELLSPKPGESILDLGCGTGHLAHKIAAFGARVVGVDNSADMIKLACQNYPELTFIQAEGGDYRPDEPLDAIFSNAALHWMTDAERVAAGMWRALKPGGRLVAEFGSRGNIQTILGGIGNALQAYGLYLFPDALPWYFPSLGEYASLLEKHSFRVVYAADFDRPTPLEGEDGLRNWLNMFAGSLFHFIPAEQTDEIIADIETRLRPVLYRDGQWIADYRRLRIVALKEAV